MTSSLKNINAMSLFVEDLQAAKTFYLEVFRVEVLFEEDASVALGFENIVINLLGGQNTREIGDPGSHSNARLWLALSAQHLGPGC